ncbi:MAG: ABC transporter ATP-binding protein [Lachnospiraceae bacterium]|nr:ABC transporter ATP-binding protein [Lachnospiraceae bacterium]
MEKVKLPKSVLSLLAERGIQADSIVNACATDMNTNGEYADGYVLLTTNQLILLLAPPDPGRVRLFKGYGTKEESQIDYAPEWAIRTYSFDELERLSIERQVACGILIANDTLRLAAFSNLSMKKMHQLVRAFDHIKNPQPDFMNEEEKEEDEYCPTCGTMYPNRNRKLCPKCMDRSSIFMRVLRYFKPYAGKLCIMLLCFVAISLLNLVWPYLNGTILYDSLLAKDAALLKKLGLPENEYVLALLLIVLTMFAAKLTIRIFTIIQGVFTAQIVTSVVRDMKKDIFNTMGKLSISFFKSRQTGSLMTRVLSDAERVTGFFIDGAPYVLIHSFTIITTLVVMFSIRWQLALIAIILMPISVIIGFKLRPRLWSLFGRRHRAERSVNSQVNDNLTGARVVKAFGQEQREIQRFHTNNERVKTAELSIVRFNNWFSFIYNITQELTNIVVWFIGAWFVLRTEQFELGILITFVGYVGQLSGPMNFLSHIFHWWTDSINSAQRMFEILDSIPEIQESEQPIALPNPRGEIVLDHVTFGYEANKPVLKNINLHIKEGEMLGIVGRSGAGKTTLVNLISRMYDPQEGSITLDGINLKELAFHDLRRNVAMVSQETYIFMGTVEQNIAYANPSATKEEIIRAAVLASAHDFILRMPDGYDTIIGSAGRALSGGERQRISIARAILANPKILILDEATASVDTETEKAIQASINYLVKGRTTISIAHRLSTLRDADRLVVIDNGEITEEGTQAELTALKGTYYKLMELQTKALALKGIE